MPSVTMRRVLITGAAGRIGRGLRETLRGVYPILRLSDRVPVAPARDGEEVDQTDIADMGAVERMVHGCDGIIHLGGISGENSWEKILEGNIIGLYNTNGAGNLGGTVGPWFFGFVRDHTGSFSMALTAAGLSLIGASLVALPLSPANAPRASEAFLVAERRH